MGENGQIVRDLIMDETFYDSFSYTVQRATNASHKFTMETRVKLNSVS
jgi:hypothetical protein